jgi:hypothetical protein
MFNEYKYYRYMSLDDLAAREEALASSRGGHHAALARMIRAAAAKAPRQQLSLFHNSSKPKTKEAM